MLPSSFKGVLELRTMRNKKMYDNLHFLAILEEFEDECSENHCFLFSLKTTRLRNVQFSGGWPENYIKIMLKQLLTCLSKLEESEEGSSVGKLDVDQISVDAEKKLVKIVVGMTSYRPFGSLSFQITGPPEVKMYDDPHHFAILEEFEDECLKNHYFLFSLKTTRLRNVQFSGGWPKNYIKIVLKQLLICLSELEESEEGSSVGKLDVDQISADAEKKLVKIAMGMTSYMPFGSPSFQITGRPEVEELRCGYQAKSYTWMLCKMGTCQRFSKDFGSFVGLCFQDFKKRFIPRQALKHGFLKDATTEKEMINSLIKEGRVGRSE
ncbi:hypothetical protein DCAR_0101688 [Daucus carota subsp. sativus]|uniref:Uncharacterized protein n=1 Tax=Daucus carota subsp. sativus TaxID=79200 RepID=A0A166GKK3_DAUCS|nr:hypothetical protein DCAR_0101688 [Daucus carota subsp. sativus]